MPSAHRSIQINRPVGEVFAFVANGETAPQWRPGVLDAKHVSGQGEGAVYRQGVRGPGGRRVDADYEITEWEPDRHIAFRTIAGPVRPTGELDFEANGDQTTVHFMLDAELGWLRRLILGRSVQSTMDAEMRTLDNLKRILES